MIRADYDIIISIIRTLQNLPFNFSFHHVRGHQDRQAAAPLSSEAHLNILCDRLASNALRHSTLCPLVPPTLFCPAQLVLGDSTITSHLRSQLSLHYSRPRMITYLQTNTQISFINWQSHRTAMQRFPLSQRPFLCKLIHRHLPLGQRLSLWSSDHPTICPSCSSAPVEDYAHFLTCPGRQSWIREQLFNLNQQLQRFHTAPNLRRLLISKLRQIFLPDQLSSVLADNDPALTNLLAQQESIGWKHIISGHFSTQWMSLQTRYQPRFADGWQAKVITAIWRTVQDLWFLRNTHLHVQSPEAIDPLRDRLLVAQVEEIYEFRSVLPAADQGLFPASLPDALRFSRSTLTTWRNMTNPAIDAALASLG